MACSPFDRDEKLQPTYLGLLTLEALGCVCVCVCRGGSNPLPLDFFGFKFCCLTNCQKLLYNYSLFVNTYFDTN